jgi:hypothetical protein
MDRGLRRGRREQDDNWLNRAAGPHPAGFARHLLPEGEGKLAPSLHSPWLQVAKGRLSEEAITGPNDLIPHLGLVNTVCY